MVFSVSIKKLHSTQVFQMDSVPNKIFVPTNSQYMPTCYSRFKMVEISSNYYTGPMKLEP
jgi:hypothetical protein